MMTPRQLFGYSEILQHEDAARDRRLVNLLRVAGHADVKGFKSFIKKLDKDV